MIRRVRRVYVEAVALLAAVALGAGVWRIAAGAGSASLLAAVPWLLAVASIASGTVYVPQRVRRADWLWRGSSLPWIVAAGAAGGPGSAALAGLGLAALVGYQTWYTQQDEPGAALAVGEPLPAFDLRRPDGSTISSAELMKTPHVLLFYRGSWCPFCVAQIGALADQYRELERRGVRVALISPQPEADTRELAERFEVPMDFYVDDAGKAAQALDIVQSGGVPLAFTAGTNGDTVVPTVVITDSAGTVIWIQYSTDHRSRPDPTTFLEVLEHGGVGAG